jgi:3-oxoacyl-[acyl-carrier protein] reductase
MTILITGGASGLGEAITRLLANEAGNKVYFTYSNSKEKAEKIENEFANTVGIKCDFKNAAEIESLKSKMAELDFDVLINNAYSGAAIKTYFHKIPESEFAEEFMVNIIPTIGITQAAISSFRKRKQGRIITILTSFLLNTPPIGSSSYVAGKAYLAALVKAWASENAKFNISSNAVSPSFMQTGLTADVDERLIEQMTESHPLKKLLTVEEVAETVLFLTKASPQMNGLDIILNAGSNIK